MPEAVFREEEEGKEEEEEKCIELYARDIRRIRGGWYYVVSAYGLENVLFSVGENPELEGVYYPESGEIREVVFEDDEDDE